jgi:hypothetical protein
MESDIKGHLITLEFVKAKFDHWRETRKHRERIPNELWEYAKRLYPQYSFTQICNSLRLGNKEFRERLTVKPPLTLESSSVQDTKELPFFAECVLPESFDTDKKQGVLEFIRKDGSTLKLQGFSVQSLLPIVSLLCRNQP